jgi:hypothetical protein
MQTEISKTKLSPSVRKIQTDYLWVDYDSDIQILWAEWQEGAQEMTDDLYKSHLLDFVQLFEENTVYGFLVDSRKGHFTVHGEIQAWHDKEIVPAYLKHGLKKIAFVMPFDIFAEVSILQTFQEQKASVLSTNYFNDLDSAFSWMKPYQ